MTINRNNAGTKKGINTGDRQIKRKLKLSHKNRKMVLNNHIQQLFVQANLK